MVGCIFHQNTLKNAPPKSKSLLAAASADEWVLITLYENSRVGFLHNCWKQFMLQRQHGLLKKMKQRERNYIKRNKANS
jgi:hypothetical protein